MKKSPPSAGRLFCEVNPRGTMGLILRVECHTRRPVDQLASEQYQAMNAKTSQYSVPHLTRYPHQFTRINPHGKIPYQFSYKKPYRCMDKTYCHSITPLPNYPSNPPSIPPSILIHNIHPPRPPNPPYPISANSQTHRAKRYNIHTPSTSQPIKPRFFGT